MTTWGVFRSKDWLFIAPLGAAAIVLGLWGFLDCGLRCDAASPLGAFFKTLGLIRGTGNYVLGKAPWQLVVAQFLLPLAAVLGAVKLVLHNLRRDARIVMARRLTDHTVVCGLGEAGTQIVHNLRDAKKRVVAIALDRDDANALAVEARGVAVLKGDASQPAMLRIAGVRRAAALVSAVGSDGKNIEIGLQARDLVGGRRAAARPLLILPELRTDWLYNELLAQPDAVLGNDDAEFRLFNLNTDAARQVTSAPAFIPDNAATNARFLIVGLGDLGTEIIATAIRCNFAVAGQRLQIEVLDRRGEATLAQLRARLSGVEDFADIVCTPSSFDADNPETVQALKICLGRGPYRAVVVALKDDDAALHTALAIRRMLDDQAQLATAIFVRLRQQQKLGAFLSGFQAGTWFPNRFTPFGDLADLTRPARLLPGNRDLLARAVHASYLAEGVTGAPAAVPWPKLPERYKQSNRDFADSLAVKLRLAGLRLRPAPAGMIGLRDAEVESLAAMEHIRWTAVQRLAGWRQGERRDDLLRIHPLLVSWRQLPAETQQANRELARKLPEIVRTAGYSIARDRPIRAIADQLDVATADLANVTPTEHPVILADVNDPRALHFARDAYAKFGATARLVWRAGSPLPACDRNWPNDPQTWVDGWIAAADLQTAATRPAA